MRDVVVRAAGERGGVGTGGREGGAAGGCGWWRGCWCWRVGPLGCSG
ncbi:hypothetical protein [Nonomuraea maheshkhaliensis]